MADLRVPDLNKVLIAGRLTADPELRYTGDNRPYCRFRLANTRYYKRKDGSRGEETVFVDVVVWDRQAEFVGERLKKGRPVLVEGRLRFDTWEDKGSGQTRSKVEIYGVRVVPLDWDDDGGPRGGGGGGGSRPSEDSGPQPRPIEEPIPDDDIPF
jgi:single-strand DNA-binding protein